jgi:predicted O-linked N-acetylglucosamine transferase (SPINDLY family)
VTDRVRITSRGHVSEHHPDAWPWIEVAITSSAQGDPLAAAAALRQAMRVDPDDAELAPSLLMYLDLALEDPEVLMAERRAYDERHWRALTESAPPHDNDRDPDRPIRLGYLSSDFWDHSAALGFGHILEAHDRERFDVHLYMTGRIRDAKTERFKRMGTWHPVYKESAEALADRIRADRIDVLVDLAGYSIGHRIAALARKPAPIQVTAWGSSLGTGLRCMDYLVADGVTIPWALAPFYRERIIRLPCMIGYDPSGPRPEIVGPSPYERNGSVTFGYLGRAGKITPPVVMAWAAILRAVPSSRLYLKGDGYDDEVLLNRILTPIFALGTEPERIVVAGRSGQVEHLETYNEIDVALDTWPENGGITTYEALLMGVPTVTRLGCLAPGRIGASIVGTAGDGCAATTSREAYVHAAVDMARSPWSFERRRRQRERLLSSVACDGAALARSWERELLRIWWRDWCRKEIA